MTSQKHIPYFDNISFSAFSGFKSKYAVIHENMAGFRPGPEGYPVQLYLKSTTASCVSGMMLEDAIMDDLRLGCGNIF